MAYKRRIVTMLLLIGIVSGTMAVPAWAAKVAVPQNVRWEDTRACWDEAEDAYLYEIQLYRNGSKYGTEYNTSSISIDLSGSMREKGRYTFRVRVRDRITDEYGRYSETSSAYVQEEDLTPKKTTSTKRTTATTTKVETTKEENPGPGEATTSWKRDEKGWWYQNTDGTYLSGGWHQVNQKWYYFNGEGYMQTGWLTIEGKQYYCSPDGARVDGWIQLDGGYYYFNEQGQLDAGKSM